VKNIGLFIDVSNLYYCVSKKFSGRKVDYDKYLNTLKTSFVGDVELVEQHAYGTKIGDEARPFIRRLNALGFITKFVRTTRTRATTLNVNIAVDIMRSIDTLDIIILGSTNREMIPLVNYLKERGKSVHIFACGICNELRNIVETNAEIDEDELEATKE